jgi:quinol-cytochrome oxidoreductase complex cytochrome b subunit
MEGKIKKIFKRLFYTWAPSSGKESGQAIVKNFFLHWFPNKSLKRSLSWGYSLWLGTASLSLFIILFITGIILMYFYVPSVERAYWSVKDIEYVISYGWFLRGMHRNAAHLMVAVVFFHMVRVFLTGAYRSAFKELGFRELNWLVGVALLLLTLLFSFTGYLLPWDQLAYWAITVGTNIASSIPLIGKWIRFLLLGGNEISQNTLIRFYTIHVALLPSILTLLIAYHMWRIRKDGGLACYDNLILNSKKVMTNPNPTKTYSLLGYTKGKSIITFDYKLDEEMVESSPNLTVRALIVFLITFFVCFSMTLLLKTPLEEPANPSVTPNPAKAPWYFLWLQELVADTTIKIGDFTISGGLVGGVIIPGILLFLLIITPFIDKSPVKSIGVWFAKERRKQIIVFLVLIFLILILILIGTYMRGPNWRLYWPWESWPEKPVNL